MDISEVLKLVEPHGAKLAYGINGINHTVTAVEVMEVPQVEEWVAKDTLIITTFYTVKDDTEAQLELIKILIKKKAAGLIVKLGRFIDKLPEEAIRLAEKHNFPIIELPSEVPYIKILTPLYQRLNLSEDALLMEKMEDKSYESVIEVFDDIFESFGLVTYIENFHGELMYCGNYQINDQWRNNKSLFSKPAYEDSHKYIEKIKREFPIYIKEGFLRIEKLKRIIVPLFSKGKRYGLLHFVYKKEKERKILIQPFISKVADKVHISLMSELISLQNKQLSQKLELSELKQKKTDTIYKVLLHVRLSVTSTRLEEKPLIDYNLLVFNQLEKLVHPLEDLTKSFVFEQNNKLYMLLAFTSKRISSTASIRKFLNRRLKKSAINNCLIAISTPFFNLSEVNEKLDYVAKIVDIGKQLHPELQVFSFNKLGIYEFLLRLSNDRQVIDYVDSILWPLIEVDPELIDTLMMYLKENGNASRTAEKLYLNRRTVTYRLKKIRELCEIDLDDAETVFILQFCLKINDLK
ncbi:hypothetical protein JOC34_001484 [Virgibacillus halotolerans]|uniref:PucR family transcriptional regulator n=1 Tax=Virgibacillus halotolerans TaxID=1071053 RepID=UPI00195FB9E2|nr:PucR family transcriptional regulator [Virgibacillus halotolerans]MBM7599116.1 hypothetical protein [Virgibacillus halotolerans]